MNTTTKILLIGGGLTAFYLLRKHADRKFAQVSEQPEATGTSSIVETIKNLLPEEILPAPEPKVLPAPIVSQPIESTTPVFQSPTLVKTTSLVQPTQPVTSINTFNRKLYSLDQRALTLAGCNCSNLR